MFLVILKLPESRKPILLVILLLLLFLVWFSCLEKDVLELVKT